MKIIGIKKSVVKTLTSLLASSNVTISRESCLLTIKASEKTRFSPPLRDCIYFILNFLENNYHITLRGFPFCFIPEALDHALDLRYKNDSLTLSHICSRCEYKRFCQAKDLRNSSFTPCNLKSCPSEIAMELTKRCNQSCNFCFSRVDKPSQLMLPLQKIVSTVEEMKTLGIRQIRFTGGEPLLRKDLFSIIRFAKLKGLYVFLNTNGSLLNERTIEKLENYTDNVLISLCIETHQNCSRNQTNNYRLKQKLYLLSKLLRSKIPHIRVGTVISRDLIKYFASYANTLDRIGIKTWELYRPMVSPLQIKRYPEYALKKDNFLELFKLISKFNGRSLKEVYVANALPFCVTNDIQDKTFLRGSVSDDGHSRLVLDSNGYFKPSYSINVNLGQKY